MAIKVGQAGCCCDGGTYGPSPSNICLTPCGVGLYDAIPGVALLGPDPGDHIAVTLAPDPATVLDPDTGEEILVPYWNSGIVAVPGGSGNYSYFDITVMGCWIDGTKDIQDPSDPTGGTQIVYDVSRGTGGISAGVAFSTYYSSSSGDNPTRSPFSSPGADYLVWCDHVNITVASNAGGPPFTLDLP